MCLVDICTAMSALQKQNCDQLPLKVLKRLHGPAFDSRYMSISEPMDGEDNPMDQTDFDRKRSSNDRPAFYINEEHTVALSDEPAWNIEWDTFDEQPKHSLRKRSPVPIGADVKSQLPDALDTDPAILMQRAKRQSGNNGLFDEVRCEKKVKWIHLGPDYHPSHLRTIECTQSTCFYGHANCKPRHFAVRILQRRRGSCADASSLKAYGFNGRQAEVWEWIEVAVNFCCDCIPPKNFYKNYN